ncbi:MAG: CHAD domain-containing protein, partial [Acidimicrobiales bacterium]
MPEPSVNLEREVKLDVGLHFECPELTGVVPGVVANAVAPARLQAIYLDTADLRLMRWGVTLRHRRDTLGGAGAESGWTLKLPSDADGVALVRTELSWPGSFGPVPTEAVNMVRAQARTARLVPVAKLLTDRRRVELRDEAGRKLAEVDDDVVSVMDGRRLAARFRQLELEVTDAAPPNLLESALAALTAAGGLPGDDRPKVVRAIGPRAALGPDVVIPGLDRNATVADVVGAAVATAVTRVIRHDPGVRLGDDPEHVHQARVGTRRLRSDLRTFWRLLDPDWAGPVRDELGWLAAALGEVRDADVLMGRFQTQIRGLAPTDAKPAAALLRRLAVEREDARERLLDAMNSDRYLLLLDNLAAAAARPPLARTGPAEGSARPEATTTMANGPVANGHVARPAATVAASGLVGGVGPLGELRIPKSGLIGGLGPLQDGRRSQSEIAGGSGPLGDGRTSQSEIVAAAVISKAAAAEDAGATGGAPADLPGTPAAEKAAGASAGEA